MSLSEMDMMLAGNLYKYIESHHFGYWHKYVENVNMTYIDCSYKFSQYQHITDDPYSIGASK